MKIGIMQPYFMPYIGYWQLMNAVDRYVIYDDVNFIKGGWINRNKILIEGQEKYFNVQMIGAGSYKKINEVKVDLKNEVIEKKIRTIKNAYGKAPYFKSVFPIIQDILLNPRDNLAEYLTNSILVVHEYLDMKSEIFISSKIEKDNEKRGTNKVIDLCKKLNGDVYYNAIGGQKLYSYSEFDKNEITLKFIKTRQINYQQFKESFVPNLSIIDVMMFNSRERVKEYLYQYDLVEEDI
ncbi:MAG: WbqC family protein [Roseburia sp.]|jgi:hypothetical protein|nr:WbqC family protein [Roseburia sp.]